MIIVKDDDYDTDDVIDEIEAEGMIYLTHRWIPIETSVEAYKETDKAYWGTVTVYECDNMGRVDVLFVKEKTWIPKSMSSNVWWICTEIFEHPDKVANRRFESTYD